MQRAVEEEQRAVLSPQAGAWYQARLGEIHFNAGHLEAAAKHYQAALEKAPRYYVALAGLGRVRAALGKLDDAIALYKQAVAVSPDPLVLTPLGDLYLKTGDQYLAGVIQSKLEKMARNQPAYNRELSCLYADHDRNPAQAVELAKKDLEVRKDIYAYDTLAWALCKNRQYDEAAKAIAEALKLGTRDARLDYHAGMIYLGLGDKPKARAFLERALQINPYFSLLQAEQAKQTLAGLGH
jgi:tetratricopeptide (TPR) repeat protein